MVIFKKATDPGAPSASKTSAAEDDETETRSAEQNDTVNIAREMPSIKGKPQVLGQIVLTSVFFESST